MIHKNIKLLALHNFFTDFKPYAPVAILYFTDITGSYASGLSIFSIEMLSSSIFEVPTGVVSDMVGRKKTIMLGSIMAVTAIVFYAIGGDFWVLAAGSVCAGLSRSFYSGNNSALLHDSLKEQNQEEAYAEYSGKTGSMFQFALAASALLGGIVAFYSFPAVMWLSVVPQVMCLIIAQKMSEPKLHENKVETNIYSHLKEAVLMFKKNSKLRTLSITSIIDYGIGETLYQFSSAFVVQLWPVWAIGISKMFSNICAAAGMRMSGYITRKFGLFRALIGATMYSRVVSLLAIIFPTAVSPILLASTSFPYGIGNITKDTLLQKEFSDKQRATMGSLNSLAGSLFFAVFAYMFGFIADELQAGQALIAGELLLLSVPVLYWRLFRS